MTLAFEHVGLDPEKYVRVDPRLLRPADVDHLVGDASKAHRELGWKPEVSFPGLVSSMVDGDVRQLEQAIATGKVQRAFPVPHGRVAAG